MNKIYGELAALYDRAFSWDVAGEVDWLLERLGVGLCGGPDPALLEPGCGSGRLFPDFARRGVAVTGLDRSPTMLERARARMRALGLPEPRLVEADMADFDLGTTFDGALCPINTLTHLTTIDQAAAHLRAVARHLRPGGRYLVQLDLEDLGAHVPSPPDSHSAWEVEADGARLRCEVFGESWDADRRLETQVTRFTLLAGPGAGEIHEDRNLMRLWDWRSWQALVASSPFTQTRAYDGNRANAWPPLEPGPALERARLTWHELVRA